MRHVASLIIALSGVFPFTVLAEDTSEAHGGHHMMQPLYGEYAHTREASGTAWQPDSSPMEGMHFSYGDWAMMVHGAVNGIYNYQSGDRGDEKFYATNMGMFMASRKLGPGTFGVRSMLSLEPLMGKQGYPELFQTGETANGEEHLIDRQHPHDLFMEMALTYSVPLSEKSSFFIYGGLPGEPALGPAAFMHRASGVDIADAPITHHWLDSTHITEGVVTTGVVYDRWKLEGSIFNGREPDQFRYNIETRKLDSTSGRLTFNPNDNWSMQVSYGYLDSPEQLAPEISVHRTTASTTYNLPIDENNWATTVAWGRNVNNPGLNLDAYLVESEFVLRDTHTIFGRIENVEKDELFEESDPRTENSYRITKLALGYIYDFPVLGSVQFGIGGEGAVHFIPNALEGTYGDTPTSVMIFVRAKLK